MAEDAPKTRKDVIIIGAGISGVSAAKCMKEAGFDVLLLERTGDVGGLWNFKENAYGVMSFTHINVSKHNYSFSDFPFGDDVPDFPHNVHMENYVKDYFHNFQLEKITKFHTQVKSIEKLGTEWHIETVSVTEDDKGSIKETSAKHKYIAKYVGIATGHHSKPKWPKFPGQDTFTGKIIHSVSYNDAIRNELVEKKVVIVGIGNSAIDAACNAVEMGRCKPVYISTRSGAWVVPNYVFGNPVDHYACRLFLWLPWQVSNFIFEKVLALVSGSPFKWGLNPKMNVLQTQPSVSPVLHHHLQREEIKIVPNIERIDGKTVYFTNGKSTEADHLIFCTGYTIDLPFLQHSIIEQVLDENTNHIKLYKNVFSPELGHDLAFIGFIQPASGGILPVSETQSRWWAELCKGTVSLPGRGEMLEDVAKAMEKSKGRYYSSTRHTIQVDPLIYCDEIAEIIGAKPEFKKHPWMAWRLLLGSCGTAQWRLQGPHKWDQAAETVKKVPVTPLMLYGALAMVVIVLWLLWWIFDFFYDVIEDIFD